VDKPLRPFDDNDDRRLIEHGCLKESTQQWNLQHPPQQTARTVRGRVIFTLLLFALATAYRRPSAQDDLGKEPVGWLRWRRQLVEQTRALVIMCADACDGLVQMVEYSLRLGVKFKDRPPGIGTRQHILAKYGLLVHG
jgi:hypothetical protein